MKLRKIVRLGRLGLDYGVHRVRLTMARWRHGDGGFQRLRESVAAATKVVRLPAAHGGAGPVFFAGCDRVYLHAYGEGFVESVLAYHPDHPVHLHVYDPRAEDLAWLDGLARRYPSLGISTGMPLAGRISRDAIGWYYCCGRFLVAYRLQELCDQPLFCLDIDATVRRPLDGLLADLLGHDIAFYARFDRRSPGSKLLAGTVFVNRTQAGRAFLRDAHDALAFMLHQGVAMEKMDQLVLYDAFRRVRRRHPGLRFRPLRHPEIDLRQTAEGLVWYPKGGKAALWSLRASAPPAASSLR